MGYDGAPGARWRPRFVSVVMPLRSLALATFALAATLACRPEPQDPQIPGWRRASFAPIGPRPTLAATVAARIPASRFESTWRVPRTGRVDGPIEWAEGGGLRLSGEGARLAALPVDLTAAELHRVDLELDVPAGERELLRLAFWTGARTRAYTEITVVEGGEGRERVSLSLQQARGLIGTFDRIVLESAGQASVLAVFSLEFWRMSEISDLPTAHDGESLVVVADDGRRGVAIDAQHPSSLRIEAARGAQVEFSYRVGPARAFEDAVLLFEPPDSATALRFPLGVADEFRWQTATLPPLAGSAGEWTIRLVGGAEGAYTFVADVGASLAPPNERDALAPTVLLVTSDTHRGELLGVTSEGLVRTPTLDALAARGLLFDDAGATSNATNPSHVALLTGLHPRDSRIVTNRDPVTARAVTLAERFAAAGWRTAASFSAFHLGHATSGLGQGFDRYDGPGAPTGLEFDAFESAAESVRDGSQTIERALRQVEAAGSAPLFLWVHLFDAHDPYNPPAGFDRRYYPAGRDPRVDGPGMPMPTDRVPTFLGGINDPDFAWAQYRALVDYVDHVLEPLLARPRIGGGVIAFTSDHGESFGEHGIWWNHAGLYPATTRVPLVLAWPGSPPQRVRVPVEQADVGHTLLNLAGLGAQDFPGRDLRWTLENDTATSPRYALAYHGRQASVDDGRWLLVLHLAESVSDDASKHWLTGQVELFDRRSDPQCEVDVVERELPRARSMRKHLLDWLAAADAEGYKGEYHVKASVDRALQALGYASGGEATGAWYDPARGDHFLERFGER